MSFEIFSLCRPSQRGAIPFEKISKITLILALRQELFIVMLPKLHFLLGFYPTVDLNELQQRLQHLIESYFSTGWPLLFKLKISKTHKKFEQITILFLNIVHSSIWSEKIIVHVNYLILLQDLFEFSCWLTKSSKKVWWLQILPT